VPFGEGGVALLGKGTGSMAASFWKESINFRFQAVARGALGLVTLIFTDDPEMHSHIGSVHQAGLRLVGTGCESYRCKLT